MKNLMILAASLLSLTAAATQTSAAQTSTTVSFADLDVASSSGMITLTQRINTAADHVCDLSMGTTDLESHIAAVRCRAHAIAAAMKEIVTKTAPQYAAR